MPNRTSMTTLIVGLALGVSTLHCGGATSPPPEPPKKKVSAEDMDLFRRSFACDQGSVEACKTLAPGYEKECGQGEWVPCHLLGTLWADGRLGEKRPDMSLKYYSLACDAGAEKMAGGTQDPGCWNAGMMLASGEAGEQDLAKATVYLERTCKAHQLCAEQGQDVSRCAKAFNPESCVELEKIRKDLEQAGEEGAEPGN